MEQRDYRVYEYKTIQTKELEITRMVDFYESFGWEVSKVSNNTFSNTKMLSLKRSRKIRHKNELLKLERTAEDYLNTIYSLNNKKNNSGKLFSSIFGFFSLLVVGGGLSLVILNPSNLVLLIVGILLAICGIAMCATNVSIFKSINAKTLKTILPVIDENEEKLAIILEQGILLLNTDRI